MTIMIWFILTFIVMLIVFWAIDKMYKDNEE